MERRSTQLALTGLLSLVLSACAGGDQQSGSGIASRPAAKALLPEGELAILAPPGYVERGQSDKAYDWVSAFEKSTTCKVTVKTATGAEEIVSSMTDGRYDVVVAPDEAVWQLIAGGKVQPIEVARIGAYRTIAAVFQNAALHTMDGVHYGVPFQWGPNVLMYNSAAFKTPPSSWTALLQEQKLADGNSSAGRVGAFDSPTALAELALYLMSVQPGLGIDDPYELTEAQYQAVLATMRAQRPLIHRYWHDAEAQVSDFSQAEVIVSAARMHQVNALKTLQQPVSSTIPAEGATAWADTSLIGSHALHPNCAYAWLAWSLDRKVQGDIASWLGSVPVVPSACKDNIVLGAEGCAEHGGNEVDKVHFWRTPQAKCAHGKCVPFSRWTQDYLDNMAG